MAIKAIGHSHAVLPGGLSLKARGRGQPATKGKQRKPLVPRAFGPGGVRGPGDNIEKVKLALGKAARDDKAQGFGPPPPEADGGPGLINIVGREDLLAGKSEFYQPRSPGLPSSAEEGPTEETDTTEGPSSPSGSSNPENAKRQKSSWLLPSPLTGPQRLIVIGQAGLTVIAFGKTSQEFIPGELLGPLQLLMRFAWGGHAALGLVAAGIAISKSKPALKWFVKVLAAGALALDELIKL